MENAFGLLKQRFRQLYHLKLSGIERMVKVIHACCVLHNLANGHDLQWLEAPLEDEYRNPVVNGIHVVHDNDRDPDIERGHELRDEICRQLYP